MAKYAGALCQVANGIQKTLYGLKRIMPLLYPLKRCQTLSQKERLEERKGSTLKNLSTTNDKKSRERTLNALGWRDAFTGAKITSTPEIDHKTPWTRLDGDLDIRSLTDDEIVENFQLLTREHNLLKDRMCSECKKSNIRPPFLGISYWYQGGKDYCGSCVGCGWYDGKKWRESINSFVQNKKSDAFK